MKRKIEYARLSSAIRMFEMQKEMNNFAKKIFEELESIKQEQQLIQKKLQEINVVVQNIEPEKISSISGELQKISQIGSNIEDAARLIMLTSIAGELDEVIGNK